MARIVTAIKEPPCPECGQPYIAKGTPVYKAIERILDEHSAWIARPSPEVTKAVAIAATVAAHRIIDEDRANHEAPLLAALKTIVDAGDCTVESIREGRDAIARAEGHASVSPERSDHKAVVEALRAVRAKSDQMAEDEGLWFQAETCAEAYVQAELRKLCAMIESLTDVLETK
jgi:hypothetical protein